MATPADQPHEDLVCRDIPIKVVVNTGGEDETVEFSEFIMSLILDDMLRKHKDRLTMSDEDASKAYPETWKPGENYYRRDPRFLIELAGEIASANNSICTPMMADMIWSEVNRRQEALKKSTAPTPDSPPPTEPES